MKILVTRILVLKVKSLASPSGPAALVRDYWAETELRTDHNYDKSEPEPEPGLSGRESPARVDNKLSTFGNKI